MAPIEGIFIAVLVFGMMVAIVASRRVLKEKDGAARTAVQLAFVWLLPFIGPLITMQLLRNDAVPGSGKYATDEPPLGDGAHINQQDASLD
jgi:hypothetical protein